MKLYKEYPATHSMDTAWYCVDEDGNVGIFQIDENGPVPQGYHSGCEPDTIFWKEFSSPGDSLVYYHEMTHEQIAPLLVPKAQPEGEWKKSYGSETNFWWSNCLIKIDMTNLPILEKALSFDPNKEFPHKAYCISKDEGLFVIDMYGNKKGVQLLKESRIIEAIYDLPDLWISEPYDDEEEVDEGYKRFPVYLYMQDYWPFSGAAVKMIEPEFPLKITQLPQNIQSSVFRIPLRFKDTETIQLAEYMPVIVSGCPEYVYDGKLWALLKLSDGKRGYYCENFHKIIPESDFQVYLDEGKAEEYDWNKHRALKK
jgi:hypothetical protein